MFTVLRKTLHIMPLWAKPVAEGVGGLVGQIPDFNHDPGLLKNTWLSTFWKKLLIRIYLV